MSETSLRQNVAAALARFGGRSILSPAIELFGALGYRSDRRIDVDPRGGHELLANLGLDGKLNPERAMLDQWCAAELIFQLTAEEIARGGQLRLFEAGLVDNTLIESYLFFAIDLAGDSYTRTELATITRELNRHLPMPALILFRHGQALTFAVIDRRLHKLDTQRDVLEKVSLIKDIVFAAPHRAHVDILADLALPRMAQEERVSNFVELHHAWRRVLDSTELNKRFYREVANWYFWAVDQVEFPAGAIADRSVRNATSLIRLITRLIFVWFLKEKGLVPERLFRRQELRAILSSMGDDESSYYQAILQNLFFATLNQEMNTAQRPDSRKFRGEGRQHYNITNLYRYKALFREPDAALALFADIPFLNGGLFECLDKPGEHEQVVRVDGFSDRADVPLRVPNRLFFAAEHEEDLNAVYGTTGKKYKVRGLIDILQRYKFTVAENTPVEEEVALDPELLGQVFENLLAAYNPETEKTARKETGSFYTPRNIVGYMVDEALAAYLQEQLLDAARLSLPLSDEQKATLGERVRGLLAYSDAPHRFSADEVRHLIIAIDSLKILDPAAGSGAFPMGVLQKLVHILTRLDPGNARWKERQIAKVRETIRSAERIDDADVRERTVAELEGQIAAIKEAFERNELDYGRKLYLIENCIYGVDIQPIAVQIAKLRCFIALIVDQRIDDTRENRGIRPLPNLETKFVAANTLVGITAQGALRSHDVVMLEKELAEVRSRHFSARTPKTKQKYRDRDRELRSTLGDRLESEGVPGPVASQLARWDPYDQNISAPFFDPEWMFGLREGFDIILANPPYVRQEQIGELKAYYQKIYKETASGAADLFVYFFHQGVKLLRHGGSLVYITNNKWLRAGYGENLRGFLAAKTVVERIVDFGHSPIFEGADVFPVIVVLEKAPATGVPNGQQVHVTDFPREALGLTTLDFYIQEHSRAVPQARLSSKAWSLENTSIDDLMAKLRHAGVSLVEFAGVKPYRGVLTGLNEAFLIDTSTKERLVREDPRSAEIIKPYLRGQDIKRWAPDWDGLWMIVLKSSENHVWPWSRKPEGRAEEVFRQVFPALHTFLKPAEVKLRARQDQGHYWWELRSCAYYEIFDQMKLVHTDITWRPQFAYTREPFYLLNTAYVWPVKDLYVVAVLNSPLLWAYMWRNAMHGKDEALRLIYSFIETIPIAPPSNSTRAEVEPAVLRLIALTQADQQARRDAHSWLRHEFGLEKLGQKLEEFAQLSADAFVDEVAKRRPKTNSALSSAARQALHRGYAEHATPMQQRVSEAQALERRLADLVNAAYGLTPAEIELLWRTAPPRMPVGSPVLTVAGETNVPSQ